MMHRAALIAELDADKSAVIAHYAEQERQAAAEAQRDKEAALWRQFAKVNPITAAKLAAMWAAGQ